MISINRELSPQPVLPLGAAWVAQALHRAGMAVAFLDLCFEKFPLKRLDEALRKIRPDGIGISIRNLDTCDFLSPLSFLDEIKKITDFVKTHTAAPILLGGSGVSIMPMQILRFLDLEYAVVGEGEEAAVRFFQSGRSHGTSSIPGLVIRMDAAEDPTPARMTVDPIMPQVHKWVDIRRYLQLEPVLPVQGKRGCANRCLYCTYNRIEGRSWRAREPGAVVEEISIAMRETGASEFEFVDSVFNQPEGYLECLLEEILNRSLKAKFRIGSLSPGGLTKSHVKLMERAGVTSVVITPETASDITLAALNKDFTVDDIHNAANLMGKSPINALWCFLLGGPKEDEATLASSIELVNRIIGNEKDAAFITTGIRIYPGTGLHEAAIDDAIVEAADDLLMPRFYFSPALQLRIVQRSLEKRVTDLSRCIFPSDTRRNSLRLWRRIGTMLELQGPYWRYAGYMSRMAGSNRPITRKWLQAPGRK